MATRVTKPVPIPEKIGDPSLIKHVFLIIRENRTYDQVLGDVAAGNGDPSLAVFGGNGHAERALPLVTRFPLFDNFYDPSRQSADRSPVDHRGPWRPTPTTSNRLTGSAAIPAGTAETPLPIRRRASCSREAAAAGLPVKIYGEYVEERYVLTAERVDERAELEPVLRRRSASSRLGAGTDTVLSEHGPGSSPLSQPYVTTSITELPAVRSGHPPTGSASIYGCRTSGLQ